MALGVAGCLLEYGGICYSFGGKLAHCNYLVLKGAVPPDVEDDSAAGAGHVEAHACRLGGRQQHARLQHTPILSVFCTLPARETSSLPASTQARLLSLSMASLQSPCRSMLSCASAAEANSHM